MIASWTLSPGRRRNLLSRSDRPLASVTPPSGRTWLAAVALSGLLVRSFFIGPSTPVTPLFPHPRRRPKGPLLLGAGPSAAAHPNARRCALGTPALGAAPRRLPGAGRPAEFRGLSAPALVPEQKARPPRFGVFVPTLLPSRDLLGERLSAWAAAHGPHGRADAARHEGRPARCGQEATPAYNGPRGTAHAR